ncbi:MAG: hypothetical protein ACI9IV_001853 [Paracoccaceae bacterium]|jgi:hypothetical protein
MDPEVPELLPFTSSTSSNPKGVAHVHDAVVRHHVAGRLALDPRAGDIYWRTAIRSGSRAGTVGELASRRLVSERGSAHARRRALLLVCRAQ